MIATEGRKKASYKGIDTILQENLNDNFDLDRFFQIMHSIQYDDVVLFSGLMIILCCSADKSRALVLQL